MALLSQADWSKRKDRGDWTYQRYKRYAQKQAAAGAARRNAPIDAFAPLSEAQIAAMARQQVTAAFQPQIANIDKSFETARKNSANWIGGLTASLQDRLKPLADEVRDIYAGASTQQAGVDQGLRQAMGTQTGATTAGIEGQLNQAGIPSAAAGNLGQLAAGGANMIGGYGASTASRLLGTGAAAETEARAQPGLATLFGSGAASRANSEITAGKNKALGDLQALIPGQTMEFLQSLRDNELSKAVARKGFEVDEKKLNTPEAPDYSWMTGPASQQYNVDPNTGQLVPNPNYKPPGAGKPSKVSTVGINQTRAASQKLHDDLLRAINGDPETGIGRIRDHDPKRAAIVRRFRKKAMLQVAANLASYYPGQTRQWIEQQASQILGATGWPAAAAQILGGTPAAAPATTGPQGAPAAPAAGPAGPAAPAPGPPDVVERNPTVQANADADKKREADAKKAQTKKEQYGAQIASNTVGAYIRANANKPRNQRTTFLAVKKKVIAEVQRALPGYPYKRIIAIANAAMAEYPSAYGG